MSRRQSRRPPPLPLADYERTFRIIHAVLESIEARTARACLFFSIAGAAIIERFYKRRSVPVAGSAFYRVDDATNTVISLSQLHYGAPNSSQDAFHCWVQCDDFLIDFMAPIFQEALAAGGNNILCPRRMFQKERGLMVESWDALRREGDFYVEPNVDLTQQLLKAQLERAEVRDLVDVCLYWYAKPPKRIQDVIRMADDTGKITKIALSNVRVAGVW